MTFKQFEANMKNFIRITSELDRVNAEISKSPLRVSKNNYPVGAAELESLFIHAMTNAMDDKFHYISYWVYDCNFGRITGVNKKMTGPKGEKIRFKTLKDLYNTITKE